MGAAVRHPDRAKTGGGASGGGVPGGVGGVDLGLGLRSRRLIVGSRAKDSFARVQKKRAAGSDRLPS